MHVDVRAFLMTSSHHVLQVGRVVNDAKIVNGYNLMGMHRNGQAVYFSASKDPSTYPQSQPLFTFLDSAKVRKYHACKHASKRACELRHLAF